jgi:hypothetical protein
MGKPFQFSMRRMFMAMACLSVTAWSVGMFFKPVYHHEREPIESVTCLFVAFISCGAAIGAIIGNARRGALLGGLLCLTGAFMIAGFDSPRGFVHSPETRMLTEVEELDSAFKAYKEKYGSYPPSDFADLDDPKSPQYVALAQHLSKAFPRCDVDNEISAFKKFAVTTPAQALVFWLNGFSSDPARPISGLVDKPESQQAPLFPFDKSRFKFTGGANSVPVYLPPSRGGAPYVYFASVSYATQAPFTSNFHQGGSGIAKPYFADRAKGVYVNPNSFQILCAGLDDDFGGGNGEFPSGAGYESGDQDNLTNFSQRCLGDSIGN